MTIDSRRDLKRVLKLEKNLYFPETQSAFLLIKRLFEHNLTNRIWLFQKTLRKVEYYGRKNAFLPHVALHILRRRKNVLGEKLNIEIYPGCFDEGLIIWHTGIVVNNRARIGKNCELHGNNCIGNRGGASKGVPIIGDNVDIGFGAVIIGSITLANNIKIGANAVVNKSFQDNNVVLVGIPAKLL